MKPGHPLPPSIRLVGALMLILTLAVPAGLYLAQNFALKKTSTTHRPQRLEMALQTYEKAIHAGRPEEIDSSALTSALAACTDDFDNSNGANGFDSLEETLRTLNRRLAAMGGGDAVVGNRLLRWDYSLDVATWLDAASDGIKRRRFSCADLLYAARWLAGPSGQRLLADARWAELQRRGKYSDTPPRSPVIEFPDSALSQTDPWKGWPGCIWLKSAGTATSDAWYIAPSEGSHWGRALCEQEEMRPEGATKVAAAVSNATRPPSGPEDTGWYIPESLNVLLSDLDALRIPSGTYYQDLSRSQGKDGNRHKFGRVELDVGYHVQLTINPETQKHAQQIARCYTGDRAVCRTLGLDADTIGEGRDSATGTVYPGAKAMWEGAAARMTAIAVIDILTGRIEALASAHTDCYRQEYDGPGRDKACPPLWTTPERRPDRLLNHAVFEDYLPGSTVKPIQAIVFLEEGDPVDAMQREIAVSDSTAFMNRMFCLNQQSGQQGKLRTTDGRCERPARIQKRAADLGWNLGCAETFSTDCGHFDLLFGRPTHRRLAIEANAIPIRRPLSRDILLGRALVEVHPKNNDEKLVPGMKLSADLSFNTAAAKACSAQDWKPKSPACKGIGNLGPLRSEGLGQGQSRATTIGVATMLARVVAAAQGRSESMLPHLVDRITDVDGKAVHTVATQSIDGQPPFARSEPINLNAKVAQQVLGGMALNAKSGTGLSTCISVFGRAACQDGQTKFAGKTGTTTFKFDEWALGAIRQHCNSRVWADECYQRPMKWYVAAYSSDGAVSTAKSPLGQDVRRYDTVVAVLSERNWYNPTSAHPNLVHGLDDDGAVNISAEIGMRVMRGRKAGL